jgi:hypothetical protein
MGRGTPVVQLLCCERCSGCVAGSDPGPRVSTAAALAGSMGWRRVETGLPRTVQPLTLEKEK